MHIFIVFIVSFFIPLMAHSETKNPQTLKTVLLAIHQSNPTLLAARQQLKRTEELYPQARSGWLPSVTAQAGIFKSNIENSNFTSGTGATTKDLTLGIDQPIWQGGRTFSETNRASDLISAGYDVLRAIEQDIFLNTARAYINILQDQELLDLRHENEQIFDDEYMAAQEKFEIGYGTSTDVQQSLASLIRAQSNRIQAKSNLDISYAKLEEITGEKMTNNLTMPSFDFPIPQQSFAIEKMTEKQNPELRIALFEKQAGDHNIDSQFRVLLPQISAYASINKQYDPQPGITNENRTDTIGLRATLAIYQGGLTRSRIREAKYAAKQGEHQIEETRRRLLQESVSNWISYKTAILRTENYKQEVTATEKTLDGVRAEEQMGQRTLLDILEADEDMIDAKIALTRARYDEITLKFALAKSLGLLNADALFNLKH